MTLRRTLPLYSVAVMTGIYVLSSPVRLSHHSCSCPPSHFFSFFLRYEIYWTLIVLGGIFQYKKRPIYSSWIVYSVCMIISLLHELLYTLCLLLLTAADPQTWVRLHTHGQSFSESIAKEICLGVPMKIGKCRGTNDFLAQQPKHSLPRWGMMNPGVYFCSCKI